MKVIRDKIKFTKIILFFIDLSIIASSYIMVTVFLFGLVPIRELITSRLFNSTCIAIIIYEIFLNLFEVYKNITIYESAKEYFGYALACLISCNVISLLGIIFNLNIATPKENLLSGLFIAVILITYRVGIKFILTNTITIKQEKGRKNLLIIGAGEAGAEVIKTIKTNLINQYNIVGIIDDAEKKRMCKISGVPILGNRNDIIRICKEKKVDIIFFVISNISMKDRKSILEICQETGTKLRILPGMQELINNKNIMQNLRDVEIEDVLGRDPIILDNNNIIGLLENNVILITGAGGSIGSELCRQIAKYRPKEMILIDIYENNLYDIELELKANYSNIKIDAIIASVRDKNRMDSIFSKYKNA